MDSIRQTAFQLPESLQRLQLHFYANGLIGWSPEQQSSDASQSTNAHTQLRHATDALHEANRDSEDSGSSHNLDHADADSNDSAQLDDNAQSSDSESQAASEETTPRRHSGMSDEEQISEIHAFIVGDETENATLAEAALMAATQLVSSLADTCDFIEPEVIGTLEQLNVQLHSIEGGLKLEIEEAYDTRCIYIYGDDLDDETDIDDDDDDDDEQASDSNDSHSTGSSNYDSDIASDDSDEEEPSRDSDSDFGTAFTHEASSDSNVDIGNGATCPVCLSGYSSNARMAALGCRHHVCSSCFDRLARPKQCPICRARVRSHMEVII